MLGGRAQRRAGSKLGPRYATQMKRPVAQKRAEVQRGACGGVVVGTCDWGKVRRCP